MSIVLDLAVITLVFAIVYAVVRESYFKMLMKYVFLIGIITTLFQAIVTYNQSYITILYLFAIAVFILFLTLDLVLIVPQLLKVRKMKRRT